MKRRRALALWLCLTGIALAGAAAAGPLRSDVPKTRPFASGTTPATPGPGGAVLSATRPLPRPAGLAASQGKAVAAGEGMALLDALLRPMPRPPQIAAKRMREAAPLVQNVSFIAPVPPGATSRQGSGLCGVPKLTGRRIAPVTSRITGCGIPEAVEVTAVDGVQLSQPAMVDCPTATALDQWVRTALKPAVGRQGGGVKSLQIAGTYACRPRNNLAGGKISEHGRGKAVDVAAVVLANGQALNVARDWGRGQAGQILKTAHSKACGIFGTTLGPGSDGYHEDHLHFDTAVRRNGSAYCR
ncbi:extensin-like domain-containing protein [Haematobacter genomosp. 1]|uniref:Extensin-like C-terminal domain-containing protein n=1 Tax=Haematobacter genomosp. 1 TaxID=366618 RepID=A0A212ABT8_9RHOB|nr:extensin family protein [Haematobacter genomosp. 1]OWJ78212.1 hypothetical protein CDV49_09670 [Haematobacter genomosp. 1]